MRSSKKFSSFAEFYRAYLAEHRTPGCRLMHVLGLVLAVSAVVTFGFTGKWWLLALAPVLGYGMSWIGHYVFEHNHPVAFNYPVYSFLGDWTMAFEVLRGKLRI